MDGQYRKYRICSASLSPSLILITLALLCAACQNKDYVRTRYVSPELRYEILRERIVYVLPVQDYSAGQFANTDVVLDPATMMARLRPDLKFENISFEGMPVSRQELYAKGMASMDLDRIPPAILQLLRGDFGNHCFAILQFYHLSSSQSENTMPAGSAGNPTGRQISTIYFTEKAGALFHLFGPAGESTKQLARIDYFREVTTAHQRFSGQSFGPSPPQIHAGAQSKMILEAILTVFPVAEQSSAQ